MCNSCSKITDSLYNKRLLVESVVNRIANNIDTDVNLIRGILLITEKNPVFNRLRRALNQGRDLRLCMYLYMQALQYGKKK